MASTQSRAQRTETLSDLRAVRAIIGDRDRWLQGRYALTADYIPIISTSPSAHRFCLIACLRHVSLQHGSLYSFAYEERLTMMQRAIRATLIAMHKPRLSLEDYNDVSSWEDVLALLDQTIASLESGK